MHVRAGQNPFAVAHGKENVARLFDSFQNFAIRAAANSLRCQKSGAFAFLAFNQVTRLFKPVAAKVRLRRESGCRKCDAILQRNRRQVRARMNLSPRNGGLLDDHIALRPFAFGVELQRVVALRVRPPALPSTSSPCCGNAARAARLRSGSRPDFAARASGRCRNRCRAAIAGSRFARTPAPARKRRD